MMVRRPFMVVMSSVACVFACSAAACSGDPPADGRGDGVEGSREASDAAIRDQVTRAAILAHRCAGAEGEALDACARDVAAGTSSDAAWASWEGEVRTWARALGHGSICRALEASRGKSRVYWGAGVDVAGAQREIVFDVTKGQAAVFTYASSGVRNVLDAEPGAYQTVGYATGESRGLAEAWAQPVGGLNAPPSGIDLGAGATPWMSAAIADGLVARLPAERAAAIAGFVAVDGSKYGDSPAMSSVATRALSRTLQGIGHEVDPSQAAGLVTFGTTSSARLGRGGSTAAAILRWAGPRNGAGVHAAVLAAALAEIETRHSGDVDAFCSGDDASVKRLSFATGQLGIRAGGAAPLAIPDLPVPPKGTTTDTTTTPDCSNDEELRCDVLYPGQNKVCSLNGTQHCCIAEAPVTQLCQKNEDCQGTSATAQCVQVQNAPADGKFFTCQEPDAKKCSAIRAPRPNEQGGICGDPAPYNATESYRYYNPYASVESLKQKAGEIACKKADDAAITKCRRSPYVCTAHASKPFHGEADCTMEVLAATCTCVATVNCSYTWN